MFHPRFQVPAPARAPSGRASRVAAIAALVALLAPGGVPGLAISAPAGAPSAQAPTQEPPLPSSLTERVEVRLILLDVRAETKAKGGWQPARGLGRERFIVQMDGDPVAIDTFDDLCPSAAPPASGGAAAAPEAARAVPQALRYVLFFDLNHLTQQGFNLSLAAAIRWARAGVGPDDAVMIVSGADAMRIVRPLVPGTARLVEDIESLRGDYIASERWADGEQMRKKELYDADQVGGGIPVGSLAENYSRIEFHKTRRSLENLLALMALFRPIEGAKHLILFEETLRYRPGSEYWFPEGLSLPPMATDAFLAAATRAANESDVRFYPVDARGTESESDDALVNLATETGGRYLLRSNDLGVAFGAAREDMGCIYRIGFRVPRSFRGEVRRIHVKMAGKGQYRLYHRRSLDDPTRERLEAETIQTAMLDPARSDAFRVTVTAVPLEARDGRGRARIVIRAPRGPLLALPAAATDAASPPGREQRVQIVGSVVPLLPRERQLRAASALTVWSDADPDRHSWGFGNVAILPVEPSAGPAGGGPGEAGGGPDGEVLLVQEIDAPAGAYRIVGVVRDRLAGAVGAGTAELQVPAAGTAPDAAAPFVAAPGAIVLEGHPLAPEGSDGEPGKRQIRAAPLRVRVTARPEPG